MKAKRLRSAVVIAASVLSVGIFGCPTLMPGESVLEGTWEIVPDAGFDAPLTNLFISFDGRDQLSEVSYRFTDGVGVTWRRPQNSTELEGDTLHVTCTVGPSGFTFDGTLNSGTTPTSAAGTLALNLELGNLSISMPQGPATLVRQ